MRGLRIRQCPMSSESVGGQRASATPTIYRRSRFEMVGTLRSAHLYEPANCARSANLDALATATNQHDGQISQNLSSPSRKNIPLYVLRQISRHNSARLTADEGRWPSSRTRGEMRWTLRAATDVRGRKRTAKSCGSGAAVLALSSAKQASRGRRRQKSRSPGRARSKP